MSGGSWCCARTTQVHVPCMDRNPICLQQHAELFAMHVQRNRQQPNSAHACAWPALLPAATHAVCMLSRSVTSPACHTPPQPLPRHAAHTHIMRMEHTGKTASHSISMCCCCCSCTQVHGLRLPVTARPAHEHRRVLVSPAADRRGRVGYTLAGACDGHHEHPCNFAQHAPQPQCLTMHRACLPSLAHGCPSLRNWRDHPPLS